ncbi:MAG: peptidase M41, partial [Alistipes sp.]|nr:peptidase M41 [Alistipes sp.]
GALNDLERVTKQAYAMVAYYGMSDEVGNLSFYDSTGQSDMAFTKPYSDETARKIDAEARELIDKAYQLAEQTLKNHSEGLRQVAELLLEREVIFTEDVERILGKRPNAATTDEQPLTENSPVEVIAPEAEPAENE